MIKNKKGMSDIVVTLVIILLSLIAIGVVWVVVNNLIKSGTENAEINAKCMRVQLEVVSANCNTSGSACTVVVKKTGTTDALAGVKVAFSNASNAYTATALDAPGDIASLVPTTLKNATDSEVFDAGVASPSKVEVTPYFKDASNKEQLCTNQVASGTFVAAD